MKTLTVTFHHTTNYGAVLQTYALQQFIVSAGHENMVLETAPSARKKRVPKNCYQLIREIYFSYLRLKHGREHRRLKECFARFHDERINLTRPYNSMQDLRVSYPEVDCLITGSDQVWNLKTTPEFIDARLLKFGTPSMRRFSYAASVEELDYDESQKKYVTEALLKFDGVSLREESAREYIVSFSGISCERVLDPVFLLTKKQWMEIAQSPRIKEPVILCYQVQSNKRMQEVAEKLKKETGHPIVSICNSPIEWIDSDYTFHDVSVEEFLGFYAIASHVVSASFHGVAMALVFEKPVYAMVKSNRASRLKEIMSLMGLDEYIIDQESRNTIPYFSLNDMSRSSVIKEEERKKSIIYLKKMLDE